MYFRIAVWNLKQTNARGSHLTMFSKVYWFESKKIFWGRKASSIQLEHFNIKLFSAIIFFYPKNWQEIHWWNPLMKKNSGKPRILSEVSCVICISSIYGMADIFLLNTQSKEIERWGTSDSQLFSFEFKLVFFYVLFSNRKEVWQKNL